MTIVILFIRNCAA